MMTHVMDFLKVETLSYSRCVFHLLSIDEKYGSHVPVGTCAVPINICLLTENVCDSG